VSHILFTPAHKNPWTTWVVGLRNSATVSAKLLPKTLHQLLLKRQPALEKAACCQAAFFSTENTLQHYF
jgi:hypothetical protein